MLLGKILVFIDVKCAIQFSLGRFTIIYNVQQLASRPYKTKEQLSVLCKANKPLPVLSKTNKPCHWKLGLTGISV